VNQSSSLSRKLGLILVTFYGLGTILGAGIYVLVGKVAAIAGLFAPLAFALAAIISFFTALSYARLVSIYPRCEGPAAYLWEAFGQKSLSTLVGWLIILTGIISAATIANGFVGYLAVFIHVPDYLAITALTALLTLIAIWGIAESMWISAFMTVIEIAGLVMVIVIAGDVIVEPPLPIQSYFILDSFTPLFGMFAGAFLAFYAFIGFEDMVNIVEEVKNPGFNLPISIFLVILISSAFYILIAVIAVSSLSLEELALTDAPLALILESHNLLSSKIISVISIFAIVNGALIQIIMGARVLYGMARGDMAPKVFSIINTKTNTPINTTMVVATLVLIFALCLPLVTLAKLTSFIVLVIFLLVNISLWRIKQIKKADYDRGMKSINFPIIGALLCLFLIVFQILDLVN
jgi:basic amino acid/polyamine antiporter, APA family